MPRRTRPLPNVEDPLSNSTTGLRIQAAYLKAGYNRSTFHKASGLSYTTIDGWETDSKPSAESLLIASDLLGYTVDEFLRGAPPPRELTSAERQKLEALRAQLVSLGAQAGAGAHVQTELDRAAAKYLAASGWRVLPPVKPSGG